MNMFRKLHERVIDHKYGLLINILLGFSLPYFVTILTLLCNLDDQHYRIYWIQILLSPRSGSIDWIREFKNIFAIVLIVAIVLMILIPIINYIKHRVILFKNFWLLAIGCSLWDLFGLFFMLILVVVSAVGV